MYKCYDLSLPQSDEFFNVVFDLFGKDSFDSFAQGINNKKKHIEKSLHDFYLGDGSLDASALKEAWFPNIESNHIFLSHSHKDKVLAMQLAAMLSENLGLNVFIDSCVWGYADELLKEIDDKYAFNEDSRTYSYEIRNRTTSNIYLILQSALVTMIDSCECLIFLNTENTVTSLKSKNQIETRTSSPWIMSELQFSSLARRRLSPYANRSKGMQLVNKAGGTAIDMGFQMSHKLPVDHLTSLTMTNVFNWMLLSMAKENKGYDALDFLYNTYN